MQNKPFDPTKPVQQRNGLKAVIKCTDSQCTFNGEAYPILAEVERENGTWGYDCFTAAGQCHSGFDTLSDLINTPVKREGWVNVYPSDNPERAAYAGVWIYNTEADAIAHRWPKLACLATQRITWEE